MLKTQHINTIAIIDAEIQREDGVRMRERGEGEKEKKNSHHPERKDICDNEKCGIFFDQNVVGLRITLKSG